MLSKKCLICNQEFSKRPNVSLKTWNTSTKYCSRECFPTVFKKGRISNYHSPKEFKKGHKGYWLGKKMSEEHKLKKSLAISNEKHPNWKGESASYIAKHHWITRKLGKPSFCMSCFTEMASHYDWHNISRTYKRVLIDWLRLCRSCHWYFDRNTDWIMSGK